MKSHDEHMELVGRYLSGQGTVEEIAQLEVLMLDDPQLRADFLAYAPGGCCLCRERWAETRP